MPIIIVMDLEVVNPSLTRTAFVFYRIAACTCINIYMQRYIGSNRVTERTHNASKIPMHVYRVTG